MQKFIPYIAYGALAVAGFIAGRLTAPSAKDEEK